MALAAWSVFDYVVTVPDRPGDSGFESRADVREPAATTGSLRERVLVGTAPLVQVVDAGLTPDAGPLRPLVLRSRITLTATNRRSATVAEASFHIDKAVTSCMRPGDEIHMTRTGCGGLGLSVVREGALVVAVGAVTSVSLGRNVLARIPVDLIEGAEAVFHQRDPDFELTEQPIEVSVGGWRSILYGGRRTLEEYGVFVVHGFISGEPGTDECAAVYHKGLCADVPAHVSAMLMDLPDALSTSQWKP
jgi:hypothetical protein